MNKNVEFKSLEDIRNFEYFKVYSWLILKKNVIRVLRIPRKVKNIILGAYKK